MYRLSDMLSEFEKLWPHAFKGDTGEARANLYRRTLGKVPGGELEAAVERCLSDWTKSGPPMPGDIKQHLKRQTTSAPSGYEPSDGNWAERLKRRGVELAEQQMAAQAHLHALASEEGWYVDLWHHIRELAWMVAQKEGAVDPVAAARKWLGWQEHGDWLSLEDIVTFRCRAMWRQNHAQGQTREPVDKGAVWADTQERLAG